MQKHLYPTGREHVTVSVARYTLDSPLWEVMVNWSDQPHKPLFVKVYGGVVAAQKSGKRWVRQCQKFRAPFRYFLNGHVLEEAGCDDC